MKVHLISAVSLCLSLVVCSPVFAQEKIRVAPLESINAESVGLIPSEQIGLSTSLWKNSSNRELAKLVPEFSTRMLQSALATWIRILSAEFDAPTINDSELKLLKARLDFLFAAGHIDRVEALLDKAGANRPELFGVWFNVSLLNGRTSRVCNSMLQNPSLAPDLSSRIYCLARSGDWAAAALSLRMGSNLDEISEEDEALLARFLDAELFEDDPDPGPVSQITPLNFALRDALALPIPRLRLPLPFRHSVISNRLGWQSELFATEQLVISQALRPGFIRYQYLKGKPAASGGIWDRVSVFQKVQNALNTKNIPELQNHLIALDEIGFRYGLTNAYADILSDQLYNIALENKAQQVQFKYLALSSDGQPNIDLPLPQSRKEKMVASLLARTTLPKPKGSLETAIYNGFDLTFEQTPLSRAAASDNPGSSLLRALNLLNEGIQTDPAAIALALVTLRAVGLDQDARAIAVELLLLHESNQSNE